jgi:hypothetical protein
VIWVIFTAHEHSVESVAVIVFFPMHHTPCFENLPPIREKRVFFGRSDFLKAQSSV